jgi:hydroxypyruvate isomerase
VEYLFPYDYEAKLLAEILKSNGLTQVLHNMPPGDHGVKGGIQGWQQMADWLSNS